MPAAFARATGEFQYYQLQVNHSIGGARVFLADRFLASGDCLFDQETGRLEARCGRGVLTPTADGLVQASESRMAVHRWADMEATDRKGKMVRYRGLEKAGEVTFDDRPMPEALAEALSRYPAFKDLYDLNPQFAAASEKVLRQYNLECGVQQRRPELQALGVATKPFLAGYSEKTGEVVVADDEAVVGSEGLIRVVDLKGQKVRWSQPVEGTALGLAIGSGRLIVSTTEGRIYCFGQATTKPAGYAAAEDPRSADALKEDIDYATVAEEILRRTKVTEGLCLDMGAEDGRLAVELARRSKLQICCLEPDPAKVKQARRRLDEAGLYGVRVSVERVDPESAAYPQRCADLIVSSRQLRPNGEPIPSHTLKRLQHPWGGTICVGRPGAMQADVRGPLDGEGEWTHQNADAANTLCSMDRLLQGPLEMGWFRDVEFEVTDRHAQGPAPLAAEGVLVAEGVNGLCAVDAFNGRTLWTFSIPGVLKDQDGVHHDVGVGDTGGNVCLGGGSVYVAVGPKCLRIDLHTGKKLGEFQTTAASEDRHRNWGYIAYHEGLLYGTIVNDEHRVSPRYANIRLRTESVRFFALDARTGSLRWQYQPKDSIRNNAIAIAGQEVYLIDRPLAPADRIDELPADGKHRPVLKPDEHVGGILLALDASTGKERWRQKDDVFGTQLAVSERHGILLMYYQAVLHNFFKLPSEVGGRMAAFDTRTGERIWDKPMLPKTRPAIIDSKIYSQGGCWDLASGELIPFLFKRTHGCGQISSGANMLLFRSATLAYFDLTRAAGTENFGGIRPGCWINAIPAAGMALVPDAAAKCACSYQMHAWLALQPQE